jgi:hypothetical protein
MCFLRHLEKDPSTDNIMILVEEAIKELNEPTLYHYS